MQSALKNFSSESVFDYLVQGIQSCNLCERMCGRPKVLSNANGNINSRVLFIAEAPGRLGADKSGIPLHGDKAGNNFEALLDIIGWKRKNIFITNAILCNPRDDKENNGTPTYEELANCSAYLKMTINCIDPEVIVTIGNVALKALNIISIHNYSLKKDVRKLVPWSGRKLFIAYHSGQRAMVHRSLDNQRADFYELNKWVDPIRGLRKRNRQIHKPSNSNFQRLKLLIHTIVFLVSQIEKLTKFKLTKLLYLADLVAFENMGRGITNAHYIRQVDGPWPPDLDRAIAQLKDHELQLGFRNRIPFISHGPSPRFEPELSKEEISVLLNIIDKYGSFNNARIKAIAYKTKPMQEILKLERTGVNMLNTPIKFIE